MKFNSKVTGGLAWAGLVLILAVPSADMLSKPFAGRADTGGAETGAAPVVESAAKTAELTAPKPASRPATRPAPAAGGDPVDSFVASGKKLPSYISDGPTAPAAPVVTQVAKAPAAPAAVKEITVPTTPGTAPRTTAVRTDGTLAVETDELTTASVGTVGATPPPVPYPASMRPAGRTISTASVGEAPLVIDEDPLARREVASQSSARFQPQGAPPVVAGEELEEWNSGSLADYLERRGLISGSDEPDRISDSEYDEDGFFLSDGPNERPRLIGRYRDSWELF